MKLFDEIPTLEDDRLILRRVTAADAPALGELARSGWVYRYLPTFLFEQRYADPIETIRRMYDECFRAKESLLLGVYEKGEGTFCGLGEFKDALHKTSVGYRLLERFWGRGYATRTLKLMSDYLFSRTDIQIITASTMVGNAASARVLGKCGFTCTARAVLRTGAIPSQPSLTNGSYDKKDPACGRRDLFVIRFLFLL